MGELRLSEETRGSPESLRASPVSPSFPLCLLTPHLSYPSSLQLRAHGDGAGAEREACLPTFAAATADREQSLRRQPETHHGSGGLRGAERQRLKHNFTCRLAERATPPLQEHGGRRDRGHGHRCRPPVKQHFGRKLHLGVLPGYIKLRQENIVNDFRARVVLLLIFANSCKRLEIQGTSGENRMSLVQLESWSRRFRTCLAIYSKGSAGLRKSRVRSGARKNKTFEGIASALPTAPLESTFPDTSPPGAGSLCGLAG